MWARCEMLPSSQRTIPLCASPRRFLFLAAASQHRLSGVMHREVHCKRILAMHCNDIEDQPSGMGLSSMILYPTPMKVVYPGKNPLKTRFILVLLWTPLTRISVGECPDDARHSNFAHAHVFMPYLHPYHRGIIPFIWNGNSAVPNHSTKPPTPPSQIYTGSIVRTGTDIRTEPPYDTTND